MRWLERLRAVAGVVRRGGNPELARLLRRRPGVLLAVGAYELGLLASNRLDARLKALAQVKASALVGCPFWLDLGSAVGRALGVPEAQLRELPRYRESNAFGPLERAVLDLAVAMSATPADVPAELLERLRERLDEAQLVELAASIAWEQYRARFNRVFGIRAGGFSEGAFCVLPER